MIYPTQLAYGIATANIQNLKDLSRPDTRAAIRSVKDQAGKIGFQETIEAEDNQDIDTILVPKDWAHFTASGEDDIVLRRSRFVKSKQMDAYQARAKQLRGMLPDKIAAEMFDANGNLKLEAQVNIGTPKGGVQPQRKAAYVISDFVENPLLSPDLVLNTHLISGVDSKKPPVAYRQKERADQYKAIQQMVNFFVALGLNVTFTGDTNWAKMPKFTPSTQCFVNGGIDKIWFAPAPGANWGLTCISVEAIKNPSDHKAQIANVLLKINKNYKLQTVPVPIPALPPTTEQKFTEWIQKYHVDNNAVAELRDILSEV